MSSSETQLLPSLPLSFSTSLLPLSTSTPFLFLYQLLPFLSFTLYFDLPSLLLPPPLYILSLSPASCSRPHFSSSSLFV